MTNETDHRRARRLSFASRVCRARRQRGCETTAASQPPAPPPQGEVWLTAQQLHDANVEVAPVANHAVGNEVLTSGKVSFDDLRVSHLFSPVSGRVTRILAQPGERVKKGAPLAVIESPDVGNAFADLGKADADLDRRAPRSRAPEGALRSARQLAEGLRGGAGQLRQGQGRDGSRAPEGARCSARAPPTPSRRSSRCARRSTARSSRAT